MALDYNYQQNINGLVYGYSDIELKVNGEIFTQISAINYTPTVTREEFIGTSPEPVGTTGGHTTYSGDFTMSLEDADYFLESLGNPVALQPFTITVAFANPSKPLIVHTLYECYLNNIGHNFSVGGAIRTQFTMRIGHIDFNGSSLY